MKRYLNWDNIGSFIIGMIAAYFFGTIIFGGHKAHGATVHSTSGARADVSDSMAGPAQCLINKIDGSGHRIRSMRGYGRGSVRGSQHPSGTAIDIDQHARNRASLPRAAHGWAISCGLVSGASWTGNPDFGHFQLGGWNGRHNSRVLRSTGLAPTVYRRAVCGQSIGFFGIEVPCRNVSHRYRVHHHSRRLHVRVIQSW